MLVKNKNHKAQTIKKYLDGRWCQRFMKIAKEIILENMKGF